MWISERNPVDVTRQSACANQLIFVTFSEWFSLSSLLLVVSTISTLKSPIIVSNTTKNVTIMDKMFTNVFVKL